MAIKMFLQKLYAEMECPIFMQNKFYQREICNVILTGKVI